MNGRLLCRTVQQTVVPNGRSYTNGPGDVVDVIDADAEFWADKPNASKTTEGSVVIAGAFRGGRRKLRRLHFRAPWRLASARRKRAARLFAAASPLSTPPNPAARKACSTRAL